MSKYKELTISLLYAFNATLYAILHIYELRFANPNCIVPRQSINKTKVDTDQNQVENMFKSLAVVDIFLLSRGILSHFQRRRFLRIVLKIKIAIDLSVKSESANITN